MRRFGDHWWLVGSALLAAVVALTLLLYVGESNRAEQHEQTTQRQAVTALSQSVNDVLERERALARVVGTLRGAVKPRWPVLSDIVLSQPLAATTAFIQPVSQRDRVSFERRTGLRIFDLPKPSVRRVAGRRSLHLVVTADRQQGSRAPAPLGFDLASNALRRDLMLQTARTRLQLATPPVQFLTRSEPTRGVVVYAAVRGPHGRLRGWISTSYEAERLGAMVTAHMPGVHLTIHDGASTLISAPGSRTGPAAVIAVAGRRWSVWAQAPEPGMSAVPWLVLSLGLVLTVATMLVLRQATSRASQSRQQLALRDAEQAALGQIATLVAQGETPNVVFTAVAEQIAHLLHSSTGAVSRFDEPSNQGIVLGGWRRDGLDLANAVYALDGVTASAEVFRTGRPARTHTGYASSTDPIAATMSSLGGTDGVAAPITVDGELWGALGAAYGEDPIPAGAEQRLERFASLIALAISNADARDKLARQASTDPLTGIANRRVFHERLSSEIARAHRYERPLSLVLIDLDHFKAVNDQHGHPAGDRVLVLFAQLLSAYSREGELVARLGGEEFAWLMPETDQHGAFAAAERVRTAVEGTPLGDVGNVTLSAGVGCSENAQDADTLIRDTDRALYRAKASGRNMTLIYTDEEPAATLS